MKSANNIHLILHAHRSLPAINRILFPSRGYSTPGGGDYNQTEYISHNDSKIVLKGTKLWIIQFHCMQYTV